MNFGKYQIKPLEHEIKKMLAQVLAIGVKEIMNNHIYEFNGEMRVKVDEGSMGIELTGILADIKMINWNKKFNEKLKSASIKKSINAGLRPA